jgi:hypothetical protein
MRLAELAHDGIDLRIGKLRDKPHLVPLTKPQMATILSGRARLGLPHHCAGREAARRPISKRRNAWRESPDAAPIRGMTVTILGLRATKIRDLRREGAADGAIADELGMSPKMVARCPRFDDKVASTRASRDSKRTKTDRGIGRT